MRRTVSFLTAVVVGAAVLPAAALAGQAGERSPAGRLAKMAPGLAARAAGAPGDAVPGGLLDVVLSLDRPASGALVGRLAALGTQVWAAEHIAVAALVLPVAQLGALRRLAGVEGVYPNQGLRYFSEDPPPGAKPPALPGQLPPDAFGAARPVPDIGVTGEGVTVAVIDSGIDFTHPDLADAMKANVKVTPVGGAGPAPVEGLPNTDNTSGHGTHVAGDVAGRGIASDGAYKGAAPGASLVGVGTGEGVSVYPRGVLQSYDWVIDNQQKYGIRVINNSYGGSFEPFDPDAPINKATRKAHDAGMVVVFAQGNSSDEMTMNGSATAPWVIAVAAGTQQGGMTGFSSGGLDADVVEPTTFTIDDRAGDPRRPLRMGLYHPSMTALGQYVVGARAPGTVLPALAVRNDAALPPGQRARYTIMSGTSMASPELAGIVALILEANPDLRPDDVKRVLQITGRTIAGVPFFRQGYGNADPAAAVGLARQLRGRPALEVVRVLDERQAGRDAEILAAMPRPLRVSAWPGQGSEGDSGDSQGGRAGPSAGGHKITVEAGTGRVKVVNAGFSLPFVPDPTHGIVVYDAAGKEVAKSDPHLPGDPPTFVLDIDLTKLTGLTWGVWTVRTTQGGLLPAEVFGFGGATVVATFAQPPGPPAELAPTSSILPKRPK